MAVAAPRPVAGGAASGVKAAMIAFVALTVIATGFAIYLYTQQEGMTQELAAQTKNAGAANQQATEARSALADLTQRTLGKRIEEPAEARAELESRLAAILGKDPAAVPEPAKTIIQQGNLRKEEFLITTLDQAFKLLVTRTEELAALQQQYADLQKQLADRTAAIKQAEEKLAADTERLQTQFAALEQQNQANREAWNTELEKLRQQGTAETARATEQLAAERAKREAVERQLADQRKQIDELVSVQASYRPRPDQAALLQVQDGTVVRTVPEQTVCYISLGSVDHLRPGMTFSVYSRVRGIPADGKGKATLTVTRVFERTAECEVTSATVSDPIIEGDLIANPVYDRNRKYNFVVAGDFDLDFDGQTEDPGGERVKKMIRDWGGNIVDVVDTRTDFVILGAAPRASVTPDQDAAAAPKAAAAAGFAAARTEARNLSIPVLTRTQFLHFIGFEAAQKVKDDQPPV